MNVKEFGSRWIQGMKNLSAVNQLKAMISYAYGNIIGFTGGIITMGYFVIAQHEYRWWWTILILIIALLTTIVDLIGKKQQLKTMIQIEEQMKSLEQVKI